MKPLKRRYRLVALGGVIVATIGVYGFAFGSAPVSEKSSAGISEEKTAITRDINKIDQQNERVKSLEKQLADERASKIKSSSTSCDLKKAEADLERDKAYLRTDKSELLNKHLTLIRERADAVSAQKKELNHLHKKLDSSLAAGNTSAVMYAQQMVDAKHQLTVAENAHKRAIESRNSDLLAINKEIRDAHGQPPVVLNVEDSFASAQNQRLIMK